MSRLYGRPSNAGVALAISIARFPKLASAKRRNQPMHIRDVMTPNPRCVSPDDSIQSAAQIMRDEDTGAVPVCDNGRAVGIITDRDIVVRAIAEGQSSRP